MKIEHFAYQVREPAAVADWYCRNLGFFVKRVSRGGPNAHFLADESGQVMIEIYNNSRVEVPDYAAMDPLILHLAFVCGNVSETVERLTAAGAALVDDIVETEQGDTLAMLRDPWGMAIQLCKRAEAMLDTR